MTIRPPEVSVTMPVGQAIEHVKRMLFQPFDIGKWFVIGFCAWLATLGESGGGFNFHVPFGGGSGRSGDLPNFREVMDHAVRFVMENLHWLAPLVAGVLVLAVVWWILAIWLSSRGRFMFLHCVALNLAEIKRPWHEYAREGNSLFWFRFVVGLIAAVLLLPLLLGVLIFVGQMLHGGRVEGSGVAIVIPLVAVFFALLICFALIHKFTTDFVVPIMFLRRTKCTAAWSEFLDLAGANAGRIALYILFQIVLALAIGVLVLVVVVATCCIAGCLLALPYIGVVALLPVLVFKRSYSLHYLTQFGPAYAVFPSAPPVAVASPG